MSSAKSQSDGFVDLSINRDAQSTWLVAAIVGGVLLLALVLFQKRS